MGNHIRPTLTMLLLLTVLTGLVYPLTVPGWRSYFSQNKPTAA